MSVPVLHIQYVCDTFSISVCTCKRHIIVHKLCHSDVIYNKTRSRYSELNYVQNHIVQIFHFEN